MLSSIMHCDSTSSTPSSCSEDDLVSSDEVSSEEEDGSDNEFSSKTPSALTNINRMWVQMVQKTGGISPFRPKGCPWRVLLPCAGWDCSGRAMADLGMAFKIVGAWEIDKDAGAVLQQMYPDKPAVHIGSVDGHFTV